MEIQRMIVLVYAVSFLGYHCSGYGFNILENLKDTVLSAQNIFENAFKKTISKVANEFHGALEEAVDEECMHRCEDGSKPKKNKYYKATSNGCGVPGLTLSKEQLGSLKEMTKCCDEHDICYGTCNERKVNCDHDFKTCLFKVCSAVEGKGTDPRTKNCKSTAQLLYTAAMTLGCKFYQIAQKEACYCAPHTRRNEF